jgi:uncharacterized protein (DUF2384 family)
MMTKPPTTVQVARHKLMRWCGMSLEEAETWLETENEAFGGEKPITLLSDGRSQQVFDRLDALAIGDVGG